MADEHQIENTEDSTDNIPESEILTDDIVSDDNPFGEEFDVVDVVNKGDIIKKEALPDIESPPIDEEAHENLPEESQFEIEDDIESDNELDLESLMQYDEDKHKEDAFDETMGSSLDVDSLMNYDEDKRKDKYFEYHEGVSSEPDSEQLILQKNFKDFLIARKISGNLSGVGEKAVIREERIRNMDSKVEIKDEFDEHEQTNVVLHKNPNGDITMIEVFCKCGEKTLIKFDFEEQDNDEENASYIYETPKSDEYEFQARDEIEQEGPEEEDSGNVDLSDDINIEDDCSPDDKFDINGDFMHIDPMEETGDESADLDDFMNDGDEDSI